MCTSVVSVYMTPYRLETLWSSWILLEVEELFGCWSLLLSAVEQSGISYRDQKMTKGDSGVFGLELALLMTLY